MLFHCYKGFSRGAARTLHTAVLLAGRQGCTAADTGHLLLAMLQTAQGPAADFLRRKRVTETALDSCARTRSCSGQPHSLHKNDLAPEMRKTMEFAVLGAHAASVARAENEHLLCAMLEDSACTASIWLASLGIEVPQAARECRQLSGQLVLPAQPRMAAARGGKPSEKYGRDLTRLAQEGRLDPVLCRDAELERMIEILCRRQKNNPCLLGEPGVGKSALAEALAQRIASGQVTPSLRNKRVLALDMASMVAGTKYRGDFEERFKNLLEELYRDNTTILFIDEIHVIAGAGAAEGAIDAANILKPLLARGEIQLIGATTVEEYRKTIQKDSALERRFGKVLVEEPAPADAEAILRGLMPRYERYHGVTIPQEAIHAAVELSVRYLPGRFLPDKAIDLLDEAAASLRIASDDSNGGKKVLAPADIARVVSKASGVPVERVGEAERERLAHLEDRLAAEVVGQPRAVAAVAAAIRRSRT
ncbi:AAA family ATPase, partial [uncultured Subdoligranulum sp.]